MFSRSQSKPMNGTTFPNGMSFDLSQGTPNRALMVSTSSIEYAYSETPVFVEGERSCSGMVMSSANSSIWSLGSVSPLYQNLPPFCNIPPFLSILILHFSRSLLYSSRKVCSIWKNTKSSTHLSVGPIPEARNMSRSASPNKPKSPPEDFFPKLVHVFSANGFDDEMSSSSRTTMPGH